MISHEIALERYRAAYLPKLARIFDQINISLPRLATAFIEKIAYWISTESGYCTKDGRRWIYNTYEEWGRQLGLDKNQVGRIVRSLVSAGILFKECYSTLKRKLKSKPAESWHQYNTTSWISVNSEVLNKLYKAAQQSSDSLHCAEVQFCISHDSKLHDGKFKTELPSIYTKNSSSTHEDENEKYKLIDDLWNDESTKEEEVICNPSFANEIKLQNQKSNEIPNKTKHPGDCSTIPNKRIERTSTYPWEYTPGKPHALFIKWWAETHFKPQGGHWETGARAYSMSYINNHPNEVEVVVYPQFLSWMKSLRDSCNHTQAANIKTLVPSWFAEDPEATKENTRQIIEDFSKLIDKGVELALPNNHAPGDKQSIPFCKGAELKTIEPMQDLNCLQLEGEIDPFVPISKKSVAKINKLWKKWTEDKDSKARQQVGTFVSRFSKYVESTEEGVILKSEYKYLELVEEEENEVISRIKSNLKMTIIKDPLQN